MVLRVCDLCLLIGACANPSQPFMFDVLCRLVSGAILDTIHFSMGKYMKLSVDEKKKAVAEASLSNVLVKDVAARYNIGYSSPKRLMQANKRKRVQDIAEL